MNEIRDKLWAVGGGKGGVGKSIVTLMLGASLARQGKKVILIDADLGGGNLHTLVGIRYPHCTLADFINRDTESIEDVLIDSPIENMKLICGADDILGIANPKFAQKTRLFTHINKLEADYIILDLGAGTSYTTMDFFLYAPNKIVVLSPEATSIQNAYGFIKSSLYRHLNRVFSQDPQCLQLIKRVCSSDAGERIESIDKLKEEFKSLDTDQQNMFQECLDDMKMHLIVNMVRSGKESEIGDIVKTVAEKYLSLRPETLGIVQYDKILGMSINYLSEIITNKKDSLSSSSFYDIASKVIKISGKCLMDTKGYEYIKRTENTGAGPIINTAP